MEKLLLRVAEAAEIASIGRTKAYELIESGAWPVVRIGSAVRVPVDELRIWIDTHKIRMGQTTIDHAAFSKSNEAAKSKLAAPDEVQP